jgi:hypothetical protein
MITLDDLSCWTAMAKCGEFALSCTFDPTRKLPWKAAVKRGAKEWRIYGFTEQSVKFLVMERVRYDVFKEAA